MASNHMQLTTTSHSYRPMTLNSKNALRFHFLPICPTTSTPTLLLTLGMHDHLLLANVPENQLSPNELNRRQQASSLTDLFMLEHEDDRMDDDDDDVAQESFYLLNDDMSQLAVRLQVPESILTWNVRRLSRICQRFVDFRDYVRREILLREDDLFADTALNSKEMAIALEFFLQMDVDVFYMKTCTFNGAQPIPTNAGLFCTNQEAQERYALMPCGQDTCACCEIIQQQQEPPAWAAIDVAQSSKHRFSNGYTSYLNCPISCTTSNIVYVMTCPCGQYEYIDSTSNTLNDALLHHRLTICKMMHSLLTGSSFYHELFSQTDHFQHRLMKRMRLYRHVAQCSVTLQLFLDRNPSYWCFIPLSIDEVRIENDLLSQQIAETRSKTTFVIPREKRCEKKLVKYQSRVPKPNITYKFSRLQQHEQRLCFDHFLNTSIDTLPFEPIDLYQIKVVAALPAYVSPLLLYIIETLFIIHGETQLNMFYSFAIDVQRQYDQVYNSHCYAELSRTLPTSKESILSTIESVKRLNQRLLDTCQDDADDDP